MHTEIHKYTRFGLIKYNGITGYFVDFLGHRLCTYGFPKLGFDNFPISGPKFHWIIPIVLQKFGLYMKKLSEAVKIFKVELRLIINSLNNKIGEQLFDKNNEVYPAKYRYRIEIKKRKPLLIRRIYNPKKLCSF